MRRQWKSSLSLGRRFFSRPQGEASPLVKHLDVHISPETSLPRAGKSKLKKSLDLQNLPELTTSQMGALQSAEEEILETLENCLQSNSMLGVFPHLKQSSQLIQIAKVKVNRDLSHVDVIWGSQILESFITRVYETSGPTEGKRIKDKIFKNTNLRLQRKEGTFRTFLMKAIEFRRVPRIFFRPPEESPNDEKLSSFNEWRKEQLQKQQKLKEWAEIHEARGQASSRSTDEVEETDADRESESSSDSDSEGSHGSESGSEESSFSDSSSDESSDDQKSETE